MKNSENNEVQKHYKECVKPYEANVQNFQRVEAQTLEQCRKEPERAAVKLFRLANDMVDMTSNYIVLNGINFSIFNVRDENALNEARKTIFKGIIYLENVVTGLVDAAFSEYEENLAELNSVSPAEKYALVKKIGFTVDLLKNAYGDNNRWKWVFVDIDGRFAAVAKNLFDCKKAFEYLDPSNPNYEATTYHLRLVKSLLAGAANSYHDRFEYVSKNTDDLNKAILFMSALCRIHVFLNERDDAATVRQIYKKWEHRLWG